MAKPGKPDETGGEKLHWSIKVIAIPALIICAFLIGLFVVGPWWKSYKGSESDVSQISIPRSTRTRSASAPKPAEPKLDLEITEKADPAAVPAGDGVKKDGNSITVTMEPSTGETKPGELKTEPVADEKSSQVSSEPTSVEKPKNLDTPTGSSMLPAEKVHPDTKSPSPDHGTFRVQAGTFANKSSADSLAAELADRGYRSEVKSIQSQDRTLYRVQVGEYKSRARADEVAGKLTADGYTPSVLRAEGTNP